ncbi:MAG: TIGR00282 family metallophosphoesterase, partial [Oscillospiraceae bacterium]
MKILFLGDVVGQGGCDAVQDKLSNFKHKNSIDYVIANGENSAEGNGILPSSANQLFSSGVDLITTGNHALRRREIYEIMDEDNSLILRPNNFHKDAPGKGVVTIDFMRYKLCVINLQGCVYMENVENPFEHIDKILETVDTKNIIVDFHCEATSEKLAMGNYLRGRVSAVFGTHTHVQTADERIFPEGTAYITDVGMCGGYNSILGVKTELVIKRLKTNLPTRFETEKENCVLNAVIVEIDTSN